MAGTHANGETQYCQEYDPRTGAIRRYTQQMQNNVGKTGKVDAWGQAATEIITNDANSAVVKVYDSEFNANQLLALPAFVFEGTVSMELPPELISIVVQYNKNKGVGGSIEDGAGATSGTTYGASLSTTARGSSSLAISAEAQPRTIQIEAVDLPCTVIRFYTDVQVTSTSIIAYLLAHLSITALAWPIFHTEQHTITTFSNQVSLSTNASAQQSVNASGSGTSLTHSEGSGVDNQVGATIRTTNIPPTLHRDIYIGNTSESDTITCSSSAGWTGTTSFPSRSGSSSVSPQTVEASVAPVFLAATTPSRVPRTGTYLLRPFQVELLEGSVYEVTCKVFDAASLQATVRDLEYSDPSPLYTSGSEIEPNVPTWNGGSPDSFSISPTFVSQVQSLSFDTATGVIHGVPSTAFPVDYTITATNALGNTATTITIEVN